MSEGIGQRHDCQRIIVRCAGLEFRGKVLAVHGKAMRATGATICITVACDDGAYRIFRLSLPRLDAELFRGPEPVVEATAIVGGMA